MRCVVTRKSEENRDEEKTQNMRAKNKEQAKRATTGNQSLSKTQKRGHSLRDQSMTRHVSVYSLRRLLSLSGSKPTKTRGSRRRENSTVGGKKNMKEHPRARGSASRRCERKNIQKTTANAPLTIVRSVSPSSSPVRSITSACDMMEYSVGAPSF